MKIRLPHWIWMGCVLIVACGKAPSEIDPAFYHWKTRFDPTQTELQRLQDLKVNRLYIKYFDVDWPDDAPMAQPQAKVEFAQVPSAKIIPTIFITNRAIQKTGEANSKELADKIYTLIQRLHPAKAPQCKEVQIDCDWTAGTRAAYFALLSRLDARLDSQQIDLSATIRLHQLKYPKQTGVPPVDRGMLMFYNMGDLDNPGETNSILDLQEGKRYLANLDQYALPLDVALPIFAWGVLLRKEKPIKLLNNLRMAATVDIPWFSRLSENRVRVDTSHYFWGHYLYAGDEIRMEAVAPADLLASAHTLADGLPAAHRSISLYHLDSLTLANYGLPTLDSVYSAFR